MKRNDIDLADLYRRHDAGETVLGLSKIFGIARTGIIARLKESGRQIRGKTETMTKILGERYATMSPADRAKITAAAHVARRGQKVPLEEKIERALANEAKPCHSSLELWVAACLGTHQIAFVPQKAVGPYNVDIALTESRIAVEIFGGYWHRTGRHAARFRGRTDYLIDAGWLPIIVWSVTDKPLGMGAINEIVTIHKRRCQGEPVGRQEHVIWGTGERLPADQYDPNTGSTVIRFHGTDRIRDANGCFTK